MSVETTDNAIQQLRTVSERLDCLERTTAESRAFLRATISSIPDPIVVRGVDHRVLLCNNAFARLMGATPDELTGSLPEEYVGRARAREIRELDAKVMSGPAGPTLVMQPTLSEGGHNYVAKTAVRNEQGELLGVVTVVRDVTAILRQV